MSEIALKIASVDDLKYYYEFPDWSFPDNMMTRSYLVKLIRSLEYLKDHRITRIYYGAEFCENKLPDISSLRKILDFCKAEGLNFTLMTPTYMPYHESQVRDLLTLLSEDNDFMYSEVVYNDPGILWILQNEYPSLIPVRGRLMQKKTYDIRLNKQEFKKYLTEKGLQAFDASGVSAEYADILRQAGVKRIEIDPLVEYLEEETKNNFEYSVYIPFGFYTVGHICLFKNLNMGKEQKFDMDEKKCGQACKQYIQLMNKQVNVLVDDGKQELLLFRAGNTIFHLNDICADEKLTERCRIVLQPYPMN